MYRYNKLRALPQTPLLFWLEPKNEAKKFKAAPASHEKLAFERLNRPNSLVPHSNKDDFNATLTDFSAHRPRPAALQPQTGIDKESLILRLSVLISMTCSILFKSDFTADTPGKIDDRFFLDKQNSFNPFRG